MDWLPPLITTVLAYLAGSLSFAVIVSRSMGLNDPRTYGSKNPGATNVLRSGSRKAAAVTLLFDALKGWFPVFAVGHWGDAYGLGPGTAALAGLAAFLGHLWPVFFRFQGGKGVATAIGVLFGVSGWLGLIGGAIWLLMAYVFRYSSLASMVSAVLAPLVYLLADGSLWRASPLVTLALAVMSALLVYRHRENITRLIAGSESRLGKKQA